ncbi:hypothetical protein ABZS63_35595, partial [Streptomyces sp. NPDC005568]
LDLQPGDRLVMVTDGMLERSASGVAAEGIAVRPLSDYGTAVDEGVRLVLGYAHLSPARIREGVQLMAAAVRHG